MRVETLSEHGFMSCKREYPKGSFRVYRDNVAGVDPKRYVRSRSDITINPKSTDGWRKPSAYSVTVTDKSYGTCQAEIVSGAGTSYETTYYHSGNLYPNTFSPVFQVTSTELESLLPPTSVETECVTKALNQVADRKGSILESVAELRSTVNGLVRNSSMVDNFLIAVVRKDWRRAAVALGLSPRSRKARRARDRTIAAGGGASDAWLNYWFGLSPIISDMVFAMVILNQDREIRCKGTGFVVYKRTSNVQRVSAKLGYTNVPFKGTYVRRVDASARAVLWYSVRTSQLARFNELGLYDAPATAWALVPYSFAVDWVLPVSDILRAWTADIGLSFRGGSFTRYVRVDCDEPNYSFIDDDRYTVKSGKTIDVLPCSGFQMHRSVYIKTPKPTSLYVKDPLSVWTAATSLALVGARVKSIFSKRQ